VIYPEVNRAATRKEAKEFLSTLTGKNISGQMPEPAHWSEYVTGKKGFWRTVLHFEI